jgi:ATP-dependent Lon protease
MTFCRVVVDKMVELDELDRKVIALFPGRVVRKDLLGPLRKHLNVPAYVVEYLLGKYCSSDDSEVIAEGIKEVERILTENYVHPDQAELLKSKVKETGRFRVIDKVKVKLHETEDRYWAELVNLQLTYVNIKEDFIRRYERLLGGGLWGIVDLAYNPEIFHKGAMRPFVIEQIRPIQLETAALEDIKQKRPQFSRDEWIDLLVRSMGLEPTKLDARLKMLNLCRLIPFAESNYNMVELGPRGTGKSYVYRELSPYAILVSGGETTVAGLFIDMRGKGRMGLVMLWDVVAFDEVAGLRRLSDAQAVQILKDYMESGGFARIREEFKGTASMVFVGNMDYDVQELLSTAHLFVPFPQEMQDAAFFDRFHAYIPGWEIPRMRTELLTEHYGFVVDYFAWALRELRQQRYSTAIDRYYELGQALDKRDIDAVRKTVSGLIKLIHPDGNFAKEDIEEYLGIALEMRRRVKEQLKKMRSVEYWNTDFTYRDKATSREIPVSVPEQPAPIQLPTEPRVGEVLGLAVMKVYGGGALQRFEVIADKGSGRLIALGSMMRVMKESLKAAYEYISHSQKALGIDADFKRDYDLTVLATQMGIPKEGASAGITILTGLVSALTKKPVRNDVAMTGEITLMGRILSVEGVHEKIVAAADSGIKTVYIPAGNAKDVEGLPSAVKQTLDIRMVSRVEEVLNDAIVGYKASPILEPSMVAEFEVKEPSFIFDQLEHSLRSCIKSSLEKLSEKWWSARVPIDVREKAEERRERDEMKRDPVEYLDFTDYLKIITKRDNWREVFNPIFKDETIIAAKLKELEPIRNAVRHSRTLTSEQREKLDMLTKDIVHQISSQVLSS